jgi:hypothetical protein
MRSYVTIALLLAGLAGVAGAASTDICDDPPCSKAQIEAYQNRVAKHLLRAQQARFEAMATGKTKKAGRYDKEFKRAQTRFNDAKHALQTASD